jgi:hypothetical protein
MTRYRRFPHLVDAICRSLAATNINAECSSGKAPTTRVHLRFSRIIRSSGLFVSNCLFDEALSPFIPIDNCRLKRQSPWLRNPQLYLAGVGLEPTLIVARSAINAIRRSLASLGSADVIRLNIEKPVQRLFNTRQDDFIHVPIEIPFVNMQRSQHRQCIV